MTIAKGANLALAFFLELCMLVAFGYWGFTTGSSLPLQILLGIGAPVLAAVFWGIFMAPKAVRPLPRMAHKVAELVIFGLAIVALYAAGQPMLAAIFAALFAVNFVLGLVWNQ